MNGKCVKDPRSKASEMDSSSLLRLDIATKRDIIGIALANLIVCSYRPTTRAEFIYLIDGPFLNFFDSCLLFSIFAETLLETGFKSKSWLNANFPT